MSPLWPAPSRSRDRRSSSGCSPRLEIRFTSESHQGQIFLPRVNNMLLIGVLALVLVFQTSSDLAHAYGISVFGAMAVDAVLAIIVIQ